MGVLGGHSCEVGRKITCNHFSAGHLAIHNGTKGLKQCSDIRVLSSDSVASLGTCDKQNLLTNHPWGARKTEPTKQPRSVTTSWWSSRRWFKPQLRQRIQNRGEAVSPIELFSKTTDSESTVWPWLCASRHSTGDPADIINRGQRVLLAAQADKS